MHSSRVEIVTYWQATRSDLASHIFYFGFLYGVQFETSLLAKKWGFIQVKPQKHDFPHTLPGALFKSGVAFKRIWVGKAS